MERAKEKNFPGGDGAEEGGVVERGERGRVRLRPRGVATQLYQLTFVNEKGVLIAQAIFDLEKGKKICT